MNPFVDVIIVTYNSSEYITDCIQALLSSVGVQLQIFIIDNASSDHTPEKVKSLFPSIHVISNARNLGFGAANNIALKLCSSDLILFLNPDTMVYPESIKQLASFLLGQPHLAMAGPYIENTDGSLQDSVSFRYPSEKFAPEVVADLPGKIAAILGACIMIKKEASNRLQGFDEDFFLYGEDQDLCIRARKLGYGIGYLKDAKIMHHGGLSEASTPRLEVVGKKLHAEFLFYQKHYPLLAIKQILNYKKRLYRLKLSLLWLRSLFGGSQNTADKKQLYTFIKIWLTDFQSNLLQSSQKN